MTDRVKMFREEYAGYLEIELIKIISQHYPTSDQRIAAEQVLAGRQARTDKSRHEEALLESRKTNRLSIIAIGIAVVSLIVAIVAFFLTLGD